MMTHEVSRVNHWITMISAPTTTKVRATFNMESKTPLEMVDREACIMDGVAAPPAPAPAPETN